MHNRNLKAAINRPTKRNQHMMTVREAVKKGGDYWAVDLLMADDHKGDRFIKRRQSLSGISAAKLAAIGDELHTALFMKNSRLWRA